MKELINISEKNGVKVVSARELHKFLEVETKFKDWILRMIDYGFEDGVDFSSFLSKSTGGRPSKEYALILDCAKEISMLQRNEKGKQARRYFIEVEKKLKNLDFSDANTVLELAKNWADEQNKRIKAEKEIKYLKPKAELMDRVLDADEKIDIGQASKILELPFGRNTMFKKLREKGIFFKNRNEPRQEYVAKKYFVLKEKYISRNNHDGFVVVKVLVTQRGLEFLSKLFNSFGSNGKMALIS